MGLAPGSRFPKRSLESFLNRNLFNRQSSVVVGRLRKTLFFRHWCLSMFPTLSSSIMKLIEEILRRSFEPVVKIILLYLNKINQLFAIDLLIFFWLEWVSLLIIKSVKFHSPWFAFTFLFFQLFLFWFYRGGLSLIFSF